MWQFCCTCLPCLRDKVQLPGLAFKTFTSGHNCFSSSISSPAVLHTCHSGNTDLSEPLPGGPVLLPCSTSPTSFSPGPPLGRATLRHRVGHHSSLGHGLKVEPRPLTTLSTWVALPGLGAIGPCPPGPADAPVLQEQDQKVPAGGRGRRAGQTGMGAGSCSGDGEGWRSPRSCPFGTGGP